MFQQIALHTFSSPPVPICGAKPELHFSRCMVKPKNAYIIVLWSTFPARQIPTPASGDKYQWYRPVSDRREYLGLNQLACSLRRCCPLDRPKKPTSVRPFRSSAQPLSSFPEHLDNIFCIKTRIPPPESSSSVIDPELVKALPPLVTFCNAAHQ